MYKKSTKFFSASVLTLASVFAGIGASAASSESSHGIAMYGEPALPSDFNALPYANPDAPKGGRIVTGEVGSFDSLNPHIRKGRVPWQLRIIGYESLMGRNWDEPFALYGLLAESIETGPNREWVEFTLRPEARFSDGSPVTVEDVLWSYETLGTVGHPRYHGLWDKIETAEQTGERSVKFTFNVEDRELALLVGMRPILKKAQWEGKDFADGGVDEVPISTSPYIIDDFDPGRFVSLKRNPDYWGNDLAFRRGTHNLDEVRYEFYADENVMFEAFKAGAMNSNRETSASKWTTQYDFPAMTDGSLTKSEIPHQRPSGISGYVMNTRNPIFADWRVREALILAFNYEFINATLNGGTLPRISSYFSGSVLGMSHDPVEGRVKELLEPFAADLTPGTIEGYSLPVSDGREANRRNTRAALALLQEAGWSVADDGVLKDEDGEPFTFTILLEQGNATRQQTIDIYVEALKRLGIFVEVETVDSAQFNERKQDYSFDMTYYRRGMSLSPGNEQYLYWGSDGVSKPGTMNWMGLNSPAAEAMIETMLNAPTQDDFVAATKALDRILTTGRYVIPVWYDPVSRIAHDVRLKYPEHLPIYGDWLGFQPDVWWFEE